MRWHEQDRLLRPKGCGLGCSPHPVGLGRAGLDQDTPVQAYTAYYQQPTLIGPPAAITVLARTAQSPATAGASRDAVAIDAATGVITVLAGFFGVLLHYMLGETVVAHQALVTALIPAVFLNVLLAYPVFRLVRRLAGGRLVLEPSTEVELVV